MPDADVLIKSHSETMAEFNGRIAASCATVPVADAQIDIATAMVKNQKTGTLEKAFVPIVTLVAGEDPEENPDAPDAAPEDEDGLLVTIVSVSVTDDDACIRGEGRVTKALEAAGGLVHDIKIAKEGDRIYFLISYWPAEEEAAEAAEAPSRQDD
jgi:hypothetical protein